VDGGSLGEARGESIEMIAVVKVGTSSLTGGGSDLERTCFARVAAQVARAWETGWRVVVVSSGAIAAGLSVLGLARPIEVETLQAAAAVGQHRLMSYWYEELARHGLRAGQILLAPLDFSVRDQYLHARQTLLRLIDLGVVPVVNENDAVADDEIRFGDNDRLAALVAHLLQADLLLLLTDTPGVLSADPRLETEGTLIEEVVDSDVRLVEAAGGPGSEAASGGMVSKVAAARMAAWSGVRTVIASAERSNVLEEAIRGEVGIGTTVLPRPRRLSARRLWIAFAVAPLGRIVIDDGARRAITSMGRSLLHAGVMEVEGSFGAGDAVEVADRKGELVAKGLVRYGSDELASYRGRRSEELPESVVPEAIHRDDLVILVD
jgi:glutamate 5-kinase